jgi:hypothetical protein
MRKTILPGLVVGTLLVLLLGAIGARLGLVAAPPRPDGPWMWVATRAAGVTALIALTLDVALGLALSTGALDAWLARSRTMELHRTLSATALALTAGHVLLLLADPFIRYDVLDAAVPGVSSYRPWAVAAGIGAAYLAVDDPRRASTLRARIGDAVVAPPALRVLRGPGRRPRPRHHSPAATPATPPCAASTSGWPRRSGPWSRSAC